jgi:hypothetical protein
MRRISRSFIWKLETFSAERSDHNIPPKVFFLGNREGESPYLISLQIKYVHTEPNTNADVNANAKGKTERKRKKTDPS